MEYVGAAIDDAKVNSSINQITNTDFYAGDMKDLLNESFLKTHGRPDIIITDPPRSGMHEDVCKMLLKAAPERIVYVSCNPATQARDLKILDQLYEITAVQPVDMFPQTIHVENVVRLDKRKVSFLRNHLFCYHFKTCVYHSTEATVNIDQVGKSFTLHQ